MQEEEKNDHQGPRTQISYTRAKRPRARERERASADDDFVNGGKISCTPFQPAKSCTRNRDKLENTNQGAGLKES